MTKTKHKTSLMLLNVHAIMHVSCANGPGARAVVWTQGCRLRCPGCSNPLTHSHKPRILVEPQRLATSFLAIRDIEGLTVSGGEPFEQAAAVSSLCRVIRAGGLSVMVFTGRTYESISQCSNTAVKSLLEQIDILVDGPFVQHLADKRLLWRGSRNQKIRFLTDRYRPDVLQSSSQSQVEGQLVSGAPLQITGFPEGTDLMLLVQRLAAEAGILLVPANPEQMDKKEQTSSKKTGSKGL